MFEHSLRRGPAAMAGRARRTALLAALTAAGCAAVTTPAWAVVNTPPMAPHSVTSFPQRDFVSAEGYDHGDKVTVEVWRNDHLIGTSTEITPADDPKTDAFDGLVEVNHPGGGCWVGSTPDILPGDAVRVAVEGGDSDETTTANVTAEAAAQVGADVVVHGTAQDAAGNPLPLDQIEQRIVSPGDRFAVNGRRDIRAAGAGGELGTLRYDAAGSTHWTATYTGLAQADIDRALAGETMILWLGNPAGTAEGTIYETAADPAAAGFAGGPSGPPCVAPLAATSILRTSRTLVNAANAGQPLVVDGVATPDIVAVQGWVGGRPVHEVVPSGGAWSLEIPAEDLATIPEGDSMLTLHYVSDAGIAPPNQQRLVTKDTIAPPAPTATPAAGTFGTTQVVTLSDAERGAAIHYSNDGADPTVDSPAFTAPLTITASQTIRAIAVDAAGNASPVAEFPFVIGAVNGTGTGTSTGGSGGGAAATGAASGAVTGAATVTVRPSTTSAPRAARALTALSLRSRLRVAALRAQGLRVSMALGADAHVVRLRVYRAGRTGKRTGAALLSTVRVPLRAGTFRVTLRSRTLSARMRPGRYVVEAAAGPSRSALQAPLTRAVTITR